jgi:hypothetical protein
LLGRGIAHAVLNNHEASIADLNRAEQLGHNDLFLICTTRGPEHLALGNFVAATADFRRAVAAKPADPIPRVLLARLLWGGPEHEEAITLLETARRHGTPEALELVKNMEFEKQAGTVRPPAEVVLGDVLSAGSESELRAAMAANPMLYDPQRDRGY